jgi:hypothetical protein
MRYMPAILICLVLGHAASADILRAVINYDFSLALNIDRALLRLAIESAIICLRALLSMSVAHRNSPNLNRKKTFDTESIELKF